MDCNFDRCRKLPEHQYESVPAVEATKLIGLPQNGKESPQVECEYAVVNKLKKKARSLYLMMIIFFSALFTSLALALIGRLK